MNHLDESFKMNHTLWNKKFARKIQKKRLMSTPLVQQCPVTTVAIVVAVHRIMARILFIERDEIVWQFDPVVSFYSFLYASVGLQTH